MCVFLETHFMILGPDLNILLIKEVSKIGPSPGPPLTTVSLGKGDRKEMKSEGLFVIPD